MLKFEESGYIEEALQLGNKLLETFPENTNDILFEIAKMKFRAGKEKEALLDFITDYELSKDIEVYELILEAYYAPNQTYLTQNFLENQKLLETYSYYHTDFPELKMDIVPIYQDEESIICVNKEQKEFLIQNRRKIQLPERDTVILFENELWLSDVLLCEEKSRMTDMKLLGLGANIPVYLTYNESCWGIFLQLYALDKLLEIQRVIFLVGEQSFFEYFLRDLSILPEFFPVKVEDGLIFSLNRTCEIKQKEMEENQKKIQQYYETASIMKNIRSGKPKILFQTSRFTTALQYHTRDCMRAAEKLGCETRLVIEPDNLSCFNKGMFIKCLVEFQPDIIFCIDHFRFEMNCIPEQIVYVSYIQDPMSHIMDKETPGKLQKRDILLNHYISWERFFGVGYPRECLIDAPIPASADIYRPYELTKEEYEKYQSDICFVCHGAAVDTHIWKVLQGVSEKFREMVCAIYKGYQSYTYESGNFFYKQETFKQYIEGSLLQNYEIKLNERAVDFFAEDMLLWFNQTVFRQTIADWIIDAGFTNIKLWGKGWRESDKYRQYAMGPAENGETLSKIYQSSKIVIGNNIGTTGAARAWESMLSGAFYLSNYIPPEDDAVDIRKIVEVDKDVIMFYNREDLIQKLHYYLEHEEERKKMAKRGREVALEKMTFDVLMKKMLVETAKILEKEED